MPLSNSIAPMKRLKMIFVLVAGSILLGAFLINIPESKNSIKTEHFSFFFSSCIDPTMIQELGNELENNYARIGHDLKTTPAETIEVYIYARRWRYIQATNNWTASGNIEGIARLHFLEQAWEEPDSKKVAVHEFAHTVTLKLLLDREPEPFNADQFDRKFSEFPVWLWEAISVYEADQFVDPKTLAYLREGSYPQLAELNNRLKGGKIYSCGYTIVEYLLATYGRDKLIELIANYGDLKKTLNTTDNQFCQDWYAFVQAKHLQ